MDKKYLLFAATGVGLGHLMGAVLGSAFYAWRTNRILCMDMREVIFFKDNAHDAFFENFRLVVPDGLEVITDLDVIESLKQEPDRHFVRLDTPLDIERPFPNKVVIVPCITPGDPFGPGVRRTGEPFRIDLKGKLAEALDRAMSRPEWQRHVIGVHYRATVGELFERMTKLTVSDYDDRYAVVKNNYVAQALQLVEGLDPSSFAFLIASDDREFVKEMLSRLPNGFAFDALRLDQEFMAYVKANRHDISILVDAVTDLWALSRCAQLIYSRSAFTHFAIMNSAHLDGSNTFYIHMPLFNEILESLPVETAADWARQAVRKIDISRMNYSKMHHSAAFHLRRAGQLAHAALYERRARWHDQAANAPEIDNETSFEEREQQKAGSNSLRLTKLSHAISAMPDNPYFHGGFGGSLSTIHVQAGRIEEALSSARHAITLDPIDPFLHEHLADILIRAERFDEALRYAEHAIILEPDVCGFHVTYSRCLGRLDRHRDSVAAAATAVALDPSDARAHLRLGEAHLEDENYPLAVQSLQTAISLHSKDPAYFHRLSIAHERQGQFAEAVAALEGGAAADPRQTYCLERVAVLSLQSGNLIAAEDAITRALRIDSANERLLKLSADIESSRQQRAEVAPAAIAAAPDDESNSLITNGKLLLAAGQFVEAERECREAIRLKPNDAGYRHVLSIALERQGKLDEAIAESMNSTLLEPKDVDRKIHLATLLRVCSGSLSCG